ncbi:MAG TPA: C39 family peptidase [Patescibacteria group bacterium]|nr:C39 family peptidase [Patescibacteria group bacterium]
MPKSVLVFLAAVSFSFAYFLTPPQVKNVTPVNSANDVDPKSKILVQFDRPVSRRTLTEALTPDTPGTWTFEDNLYKSFLYKKAVFTPITGLNPDTNYTVKLTNITNSLRTSKPYNFEFSFKTKPNPEVKKEIEKEEAKTFKLSVPSYIQQHTLSCEVASLRMTLAYKGITKSEDELLAQVGVDNTPHSGGIWGDPYEHFVGNVNGNQMRNGYGVYWGPIERVAKSYGNAKAFEHGDIKLLTDNIKKGNPIIIWVYSSSGAPTHWKTPSGRDIFAVAGEHTVVVAGFVGPSDNPTQIIVNDSLTGQVYWPRNLFDHKWSTFGQSGVIIYK